MIIRIAQVCLYIIFCLLLRTGPWRYFQLNARYFNPNKGIFSKLDIDKLIPVPWRLPQWVDHPGIVPKQFPVFLKPEWGQNSKGIQRANNLAEFNRLRTLRPKAKIQYLVQQAAKQDFEYEIFLIPSVEGDDLGCLSISQVFNLSQDDYPINGIHNPNTHYVDISAHFSMQQKQQLWGLLRKVADFNISRFGIRANSLNDLLAGDFSIIEINLFLPMPLLLLSDNTPQWAKWKFIFRTMWLLAKVTRQMPNDHPYKHIFFKKMGFFYQLNNLNRKEIP
jgi:hypothetical protein